MPCIAASQVDACGKEKMTLYNTEQRWCPEEGVMVPCRVVRIVFLYFIRLSSTTCYYYK